MTDRDAYDEGTVRPPDPTCGHRKPTSTKATPFDLGMLVWQPMVRSVCLWCGDPLVLTQEHGFVHEHGGGLYVQYCRSCGWTGSCHPAARACPRCGSHVLHDDHCALPDGTRPTPKG